MAAFFYFIAKINTTRTGFILVFTDYARAVC